MHVCSFNVEFNVVNISLILKKLSLDELTFNLKSVLPKYAYAASNADATNQQQETDVMIDNDL